MVWSTVQKRQCTLLPKSILPFERQTLTKRQLAQSSKEDSKKEHITLSVTMPERRPLTSVSSTASTRLAAIRRHASDTVVPSGIVSAFDSRSFLTVLSPLTKPTPGQHFGQDRGGKQQKREEAFGRLRDVVGRGGLGGALPVSVGGSGGGIIRLAGGGRRRRTAARASFLRHGGSRAGVHGCAVEGG